MKQQEKLVRDMEATVLRRDIIITRGEFLNKNPNVMTNGKLQREMIEIQKRIKDTNQVNKNVFLETYYLDQKF